MKTTAQIRQELDALNSELEANIVRITEISELKKQLDNEQLALSNRIKAIKGWQDWRFWRDGLIDNLNLELLESQRPIYKQGTGESWNRTMRIISVDKKWIELKEDGQSLDLSTKYNRETGWKMRARDEYGAINAQEALAIWNEFNGAQS